MDSECLLRGSISMSLNQVEHRVIGSLLGDWLGLEVKYTQFPDRLGIGVEFMRHGEVFFSRFVDECDFDEYFEFYGELGQGAFILTHEFSGEVRDAFMSKYACLVEFK